MRKESLVHIVHACVKFPLNFTESKPAENPHTADYTPPGAYSGSFAVWLVYQARPSLTLRKSESLFRRVREGLAWKTTVWCDIVLVIIVYIIPFKIEFQSETMCHSNIASFKVKRWHHSQMSWWFLPTECFHRPHKVWSVAGIFHTRQVGRLWKVCHATKQKFSVPRPALYSVLGTYDIISLFTRACEQRVDIQICVTSTY